MGREEEQAKIDRAIKDAEVRIRTFQTNIDAIDKEISIVSLSEKALEENVKCLKTKRIIAIAQEYKKAKEDLKKTQNRLLILRNDREHFNKALCNIEDLLKQSKKELDKLQNSVDNNVLSFKSRRKDG